MSIFLFCVGVFTVGFTAGAMTIITLANRLDGYVAGNGKRVKLIEIAR